MSEPVVVRLAPALTSLRGVGAVAVCYIHATFVLGWTLREYVVPLHLFLWVDYFFILSGFVMTHVYADRLRQGNRAELREYFVARVARVYPLHFMVLSTFVVVEAGYWLARSAGVLDFGREAFTGYFDPKLLPAHYLLVQSWGWSRADAWNVPAWSISTEAMAYLLFPLLARFGLQRGPRIAFLLLLLCVIAPMALFVVYSRGMDSPGLWILLRCLMEFTLGCLLRSYAPRLLAYIGRELRRVLEWPTALAVFAVMVPGPHQYLAPVVFAVLILLLAAPDSRLAAVLQAGPLPGLGEKSYSIYLVHTLILLLIGSTLWAYKPAWLASAWAPPLILTVFIGTVLLVSDQTYKRIEVPARSAIRSWLTRRPARAIPIPAETK
jgi:hypothetical protein